MDMKVLQTAGFGAKQAKELQDARNGFVSARVGRESAKGKKKISGKAHVDALNEALSTRLLGRAVLSGVLEDLEGSTEGEGGGGAGGGSGAGSEERRGRHCLTRVYFL